MKFYTIKRTSTQKSFYNILAGGESLSWHPLIQDLITVGRKLEKLGFVYNKGNVIFIDLEENYFILSQPIMRFNA